MHNISTYALEPFYFTHRSVLCEESRHLLTESMNEMVKDAAQFIIGAAVEYGLVATVAGAPAGPVVETITDAMFTAESIATTLDAVGDIVEMFGELQVIIQKVLSLNLKGGFETFYTQVLEVWQSVDELLPDHAGDKLSDLITEAQETLKKAVTKFADFVGDAVKLVIPEATIGTIAGEALQQVLMAVAKNAYALLTKGIAAFGKYQKVVTDPEYAIDLFNTAFSEIHDLLNKLEAKMKERPEGIGATFSGLGISLPGMSEAPLLAPALGSGNLAGGVIGGIGGDDGDGDSGESSVGIADTLTTAVTAGPQAALAEKAISLFRDFLTQKQPLVMTLVGKITRVMFPAIFALLASYQILAKNEWRSQVKKGVKKGMKKAKAKKDSKGSGSVEALLSTESNNRLDRLFEITGGGIGVEQSVGYGQNYHTLNPDPITWENLEGPEYFVTTQADGTCLAGVSLPGTDLVTPTYRFGDEGSAMSWVRNTFDKFRRQSMALEN